MCGDLEDADVYHVDEVEIFKIGNMKLKIVLRLPRNKQIDENLAQKNKLLKGLKHHYDKLTKYKHQHLLSRTEHRTGVIYPDLIIINYNSDLSRKQISILVLATAYFGDVSEEASDTEGEEQQPVDTRSTLLLSRVTECEDIEHPSKHYGVERVH